MKTVLKDSGRFCAAEAAVLNGLFHKQNSTFRRTMVHFSLRHHLESSSSAKNPKTAFYKYSLKVTDALK